MSHAAPVHATLDEWIAREATSFSVDSPESLSGAVDKLVGSLADSVELLGFGEALHGGEDVLILRNRLFKQLVESHGYSAIAVESSLPRGRLVNDYVAGRGPASFEAVQEAGFSHGFGQLDANRELVQWMRQYNADASHRVKVQFYGFDSPTEMVVTDSPRNVLYFVLDYLAANDGAQAERRQKQRQRIDALLGQDADWENPAAAFDPTKGVGLSAGATALRIETEDLLTELRVGRPDLAANSGDGPFLEAVHYASMARQLLNYHAGVAGRSSDRDRLVSLLGLRDLMMADNLAYAVGCERDRGSVLAFAHNSHLKRGKAQWQLGPHALAWWPAGAHLQEMFGPRYAVIGTALGVSDANGIGPPEVGTLEHRLTGADGPARFIPTHQGQRLRASDVAAIPTRTGSAKNPTYFALTPQSLTDFDWLAVLDSTTYTRGGPPLPEPQSAAQPQSSG